MSVAWMRVASGVLLLGVALQVTAVEKGQTLHDALDELRSAGLHVVFSSTLVEPSLVVLADPGAGTPEEIARRILMPHGLQLSEVSPGVFAVVPSRAEPVSPAERGSDAPLPPPGQLTEVKVFASRYEIGRQPTGAPIELTRRDLQGLPGLEQDAMRVTHYLPGTASNSLSARTHVRGGREDELSAWFDGAPLFEPFHYKDVQGIVGILDPGAIQSVEFYSGVFPARYGNSLAGVLDFKPRAGTDTEHHEIGASLLYFHALSQGHLGSHPVQWLGAVRHSSVDLVTDALGRTDVEPNFLDALGRIEWRPGERSTLAVGWLLLDDGLDADVSDGTELANLNYRDGTAWLNWQYAPSPSTELRTVLSYTDRRTDRTGSLQRPGSALGTVADRRRFDTRTARIEGAWRVNAPLRLSAGVEWYGYGTRYDYFGEAQYEPALAAALARPVSFSRSVNLVLDGHAYAAYTAAQYEFARGLSLDAGIRWDQQRYDTGFRQSQLSPRLALQYELPGPGVLRMSWGRTAQAERPDELQVADGETRFQPVQRATQTVLSLELPWSEDRLLRLEAYNKRISSPRAVYENLFDPFALLPELEFDRVRVAPDSSRVYGAEASLRLALGRTWWAWTSYSWSEATDRFDSNSAPRSWDQKHGFAGGVSWQRAPWQLSSSLSWRSGWQRNVLTQSGDTVTPTERNTRAWPDYLSLDLHAGWSRPVRHGALELYAEVNNATNHANYCCRSYEVEPGPAGGQLAGESSVWLPRYFMLGARWNFPD